MISPAIDAFLACFLLVVLCEMLFLPATRRRQTGELIDPFPSLAVALVVTWGMLGALGPGHYGLVDGAGSGPLFSCAIAGLLVLFAGLQSERGRASSTRHFKALLLAGVCITIGGMGVPWLNLPWIGTFALWLPFSLLITVAWIFLIGSLIEVLSLVPLLVSFALLATGCLLMAPVEFWQSFTGEVLCASILGAVIGRAAGEVLVAHSHPFSKSEVLVAGFAIAAATLGVFAKSVVLISLVIPVSMLVTVFVLLVMHSLDSSLVTRPRPRE